MKHEGDDYFVIGTFVAVTKILLKGLKDLEIGGQVETIQITTLLRSLRILRRVLETCCHSIAQKEYKTRQYWVLKVIHWELCKKFKYDYTNEWYMHNPVSVLENEMHKLL